jgi:predicted small lipoprotein YifL
MPTMSLLHRGLLLVPIFALALVAGCGRKGPLYVVPPPPPADSTPIDQPSAKTPVGAESKPEPVTAQPDR